MIIMRDTVSYEFDDTTYLTDIVGVRLSCVYSQIPTLFIYRKGVSEPYAYSINSSSMDKLKDMYLSIKAALESLDGDNIIDPDKLPFDN